jgi:hypothetical protein
MASVNMVARVSFRKAVLAGCLGLSAVVSGGAGVVRQAMLTGRVVDGVQGAAVAAATVTVRSRGTVQTVHTADDGRFAITFKQTSAEAVFVSASKPGFEPGRLGQRFPGDQSSMPLSLGQPPRAEVQLKLWKLATLRGHVEDENKRPVVGAQVRALRLELVAGRKRLVTSLRATTDDRGEYSMTLGAASRYVVAVEANESIQTASMFFPSATVADHAQLIDLGQGETREDVNFVIRPTKGFAVAGKLTGVTECVVPIQLTLTPAAQLTTDLPSRKATSTSSCEFKFENVRPGLYLVRALRYPVHSGGSQPFATHASSGALSGVVFSSPIPSLTSRSTRWVEGTVGIVDQAVYVELPVHPGATFSGKIVFDASGKQPPPSTYSATAVLVTRADGESLGDVPISPIAEDGSFETVGLPPGKYLLDLLPLRSWGGWFAGEIRLKGKDLAGLPVDLTAGGMDGLVFHMTRNGRFGRVAGRVTDNLGQPANDASVYVFSTDRRYWVDSGTVPPRRLREVRPGNDGGFSADALPAGDYHVIAIVPKTGDWRDPDVLGRLVSYGKVVKIEEGRLTTLDLKASQGPSTPGSQLKPDQLGRATIMREASRFEVVRMW